jgi:hypothetical protein
MPLPRLVETDLIRACRMLFGSDLQINRDFLEYLQLSGVKSAFRKKALEIHPDKVAMQEAVILDRHTALFRDIQQAYRELTDFLSAREKGFRLPPLSARERSFFRPRARGDRNRKEQNAGFQPRRQSSRFSNSSADGRFYLGPLPERTLLFGHFLYYSCAITWRMIIQAIIWQRAQRPRLGQLGQRFGWLTRAEIEQILRDHKILQPFGQTAIGLGLLNERQVRILLFQQQRLQKKIGEFFLQEGILTPAKLQEMLLRFQKHNTRLTAAVLNNRL